MFNPSTSISQLDRYNSIAQAYAQNYGVNLTPRKLTPQQIQNMQERRKQALASTFTTAGSAPQNVLTAVKMLEDRINGQWNIGSDNRVYWKSESGATISSNMTKIRSNFIGDAIYFNPSWGVVINWNKFVGSSNKLDKYVKNGWTDQDLMNKAAKSTYKNYIKKGIQYARDPTQFANNMQQRYDGRISKLEAQRDAKIASIKSIGDIFKSRVSQAPTMIIEDQASQSNIGLGQIGGGNLVGLRGVAATGSRISERGSRLGKASVQNMQ